MTWWLRLYLIVLTLLAVVGQVVVAGDAGSESPFSLGAGARSLGMGGCFTSLAKDATSVYYNPAGLGYLSYTEAGFMHSELIEGATFDFASLAYPISNAKGVGIAVMRIGVGDIIRRENYADRGKFDYSSSQIVLSYGMEFGRLLAVGASVKVVNQSIDNLSDFGGGLDLAVGSRLNDYLSLGLIARNAVPASIQLDGFPEKMPRSAVLGASIEGLPLTTFTRIAGAVDIEKFEDRSIKFHTGGEVTFHQTLALRIGYDRNDIALGIGLAQGPLSIDYAYRLHDYLANTHHISLSFRLGKSVEERTDGFRSVGLPARPLSAEEQELADLKSKADSFFRRFELDSALVYFQKCRALDSTDAEIALTIPAIENALRLQLEREGRIRTAEQDQERYLRNFYARSQMFFDRKNYSAALDLLDLILDISPENVQALHLKSLIDQAVIKEVASSLDTARVAESEGRIIRAIESYNRILDLDPGNTGALTARQRALDNLDWPQQLNLGISLYESNRLAEARNRFNAVLRLKPGEPVALEYLKKLDAPPARRRAATLEDIQRDPQNWQCYLDGLRFMRNGEYQKAIDEWDKVLQVYPDNPNTLNNIEQARLRLDTK